MKFFVQEALKMSSNPRDIAMIADQLAEEARMRRKCGLKDSGNTHAPEMAADLPARVRFTADPQPLIDAGGVVHDLRLGIGYRPRTHLGIEARDTTVSGLPHRAASIAPPQPARLLGGPAITGLNGHLYPRAARRTLFS